MAGGEPALSALSPALPIYHWALPNPNPLFQVLRDPLIPLMRLRASPALCNKTSPCVQECGLWGMEYQGLEPGDLDSLGSLSIGSCTRDTFENTRQGASPSWVQRDGP